MAEKGKKKKTAGKISQREINIARRAVNLMACRDWNGGVHINGKVRDKDSPEVERWRAERRAEAKKRLPLLARRWRAAVRGKTHPAWRLVDALFIPSTPECVDLSEADVREFARWLAELAFTFPATAAEQQQAMRATLTYLIAEKYTHGLFCDPQERDIHSLYLTEEYRD
jgi:hypothetical protein